MDRQLLAEIMCVLDRVNKRGDRFSSNAEWTSAITKGLFALGRLKGYTVAHPGKWGWLYDIAWLDYEDFDARLLRRLPLAVESEWYPDIVSLRVDFNKLLFSRAELSVMIFSDWISGASRTNGKIWDFNHQIEIFRASMRKAAVSRGSGFLFACYEHSLKDGLTGGFRYAYAEEADAPMLWTSSGWEQFGSPGE